MALLYVPQGVEQSDYALNVTTAGVAITFKTAFSSTRLTSGDYDLTVHGYDSLDETTKQEIYCRVQRTPTGITVIPDANCAYITWHATPLNAR